MQAIHTKDLKTKVISESESNSFQKKLQQWIDESPNTNILEIFTNVSGRGTYSAVYCATILYKELKSQQ